MILKPHAAPRLARFAAAAFAVFLVAWPRPAAPHGDLDAEIAGLTRLMRAHPKDAKLVFRRAEIQCGAGMWEPAIADYQACLQLDPTLAESLLGLGRALDGANKLDDADLTLTRFVELRPENGEGFAARGRVHAKLGRGREAAADFTRAIELSAHPNPEDFMARAQALAATEGDAPGEGIAAAIASLDDAMAKLGPAPTLAIFAAELESRRGRADAALKRLDAIQPKSKATRKDWWLAKRAEILDAAGRRAEARAAREQALAEIEALSPFRRQAAATRALESGLRSTLARPDAEIPKENANR